MALNIGVKIPWLEQQTGVRYDTLRRHYGKWIPQEGESELRRFEAYEPRLFGANCAPLSDGVGHNFRKALGISTPKECERGDLNPKKDAELKDESSTPNRQEPPSTATNCAPGGTISKRKAKR
jgi:hypothetical protein